MEKCICIQPSSFFVLSLHSGVATAYHVSQSRPVFNVCLPRTKFPHIFFTTSKNLIFGLPLFLFPGNSTSIIFLPTYSWYLLMTRPYHLIFIPNRSTLTVPLMCSFLILSFLVTHITNLNIFISATFIFSICFFVIITV